MMTSMMADAPHLSSPSPSAEPPRPPRSSPPIGPDGSAELDPRARAAILITPIAIVIICIAMCIPPASRRFYEWLTSENRPVENWTFLFAIVATVLGIRLSTALFARRARFAAAFYFVFALGMFFIAMEEISWGQQFFGWQTPVGWSHSNAQNETTLHNLGPFQGHNDILRFAFGFGGLFGILLAPLLPRLRILFPHRVLIAWFLIIAAVSVSQMYCDASPDGPLVGPLNRLGDRLAEVIELMIAIAAVLYLWLNRRRFVAGGGGSAHQETRAK